MVCGGAIVLVEVVVKEAAGNNDLLWDGKPAGATDASMDEEYRRLAAAIGMAVEVIAMEIGFGRMVGSWGDVTLLPLVADATMILGS